MIILCHFFFVLFEIGIFKQRFQDYLAQNAQMTALIKQNERFFKMVNICDTSGFFSPLDFGRIH